MGRKTPQCEVYDKWTTARFWGFIRSTLRQATRKWPPKNEAKKLARRPYTGDNPRVKWEYQCYQCKEWFMEKQIEVDHLIPAGTLRDYNDLPDFVRKLFCNINGFGVICKSCHKIKTKKDVWEK